MTEKNILIKDQEGNSLYPQTQASLVIGGLSYEDLNKEIEMNPTSIMEEWQTYQEQVNSIIEAYQQQVNNLRTELNEVKSVRYVVESWQSGKSWYTVYSDGWCEQGGCSASASVSSNIHTINLFKSYKDTNFNWIGVANLQSSDTGAYWIRQIPNTDGSTIKFFMYLNNAVSKNQPAVCWEAKGYIL